ncbi:MAG: tail fiber protein [Cellvibrionaceae bacterium]
MAEPFVGEVKFFSFNWPPRNWVPCDGRLLPIAQNQALFALLGNTFGGDGTTNFAVPDLRGRVPMHTNANTPQGTKNGTETVALNLSQMPSHSHLVKASNTTGTVEDFEGAVFAAASRKNSKIYAQSDSLQPLDPNTVSPTGSSQPHSNCQPSLVGNYCIAINGIFPSRS